MIKLYNLNFRKMLNKLGLLVFSTALFGLQASAQTNLAPLATASASPACNTGPCTTLNDLNFGTCGTQQMWITSSATNPGSSVNVTFIWSSMQVIKGMTIHAGQQGSRFLAGGTIQVLNGSNWVNHATFVQSNLNVCNYNIDFNPVATTGIRIIDMVVSGSQSSNVNFREIEIWQGSIAPNDVGIAAIDSPMAVCAGTYGLRAKLQNFGTNQVTSAVVNWSLDGVAQTSIPFTGLLDTAGGSGSTFANIMLSTSLVVNNTPKVVKAWTYLPNNTVDSIKDNDSTTASIRAALVGNFTIGGTNPDFTTVQQAVAAMKTAGLCGPVNFTIAPGTYNGNIELTGPIPGNSSTNTITFNGLNRDNVILTSSSSQTATLLISNVDYVTVKNITVENTFAGNCSGLAIAGTSGTNYLVDSCKILLPNVGTATSYGLILTGTGTGYGLSNNTIDSVTFSNNIIDGGYYGLVMYGNTGGNANWNKGRRILNNRISAYYMGAYVYYNYNGVDFINNYIDMSTANSGTQYGLYFYYNQTFNSTKASIIANNTVKNASYYGMYIYYANGTVANPTLIYNNVLAGGFRATTNYALYVANNSSYVSLVYHNSVLVDGPSTKYGFYYTGGSTASQFKNNIFMVNGTSGTSYPAYWSTNPATGNINYNVYYNTVNTTLGYRGSAFTTANFQTATTGGDSSVNAMPIWNNELRVGDGCLLKGADLTSVVATDIDGQTRSTTPDAGADEFPAIANNIALLQILEPQAPIVTGFQNLKVVIRNVGSTSITNVGVNYKNNNNTTVTQIYSGVLAPCSQDTVTFSGANQINLTNLNNLLVYTSTPNFNPDGDPSNDTIRVTLRAPLSGTYTIGGATADFNTIGEAADALTSSGVGGSVTFNINPGIYNGQVIINGPIAGASATNSITFDGVNSATRKITASVPAAVLIGRNCSYVTFKNLTVENTAAINTVRSGIAFAGSAGVGNKVIKCVVDLGVNTGTSANGYGIIYSGDLNGVGVTATSADSSVIDSNIVNGGGYSIVHYGASSASANRGLIISNNIVNNSNYMGGYIAYNYNPIKMINNEFNMLGINYGYYGVYYYYNQSSDANISHEIIGNKIIGFGGYGIYLYYPINNASAAKVKVYNNLIIGNSQGTSYPGYYGLYLYQASSSYNADVYHNTISMEGAANSTTYTCFYNTGSTLTNVKNNIFRVTNGTATPCYLATNPTGNRVNYNIYYNATNPSTGNLIYRGTFYNPSNFQTATAGGDSSLNIVPPFAGNNDYTLSNGCIRGVDLTSDVPSDINGLTRSMTPNIGAYEYPGTSLDIMPEAIVSPSFPVAQGTQPLRVLVRNNGSNTVTSFSISYRLNGGTPVSTIWSGTLASCATDTVNFSGAQQVNIVNQSNTLRVYTANPNFSVDGNLTNDTLDTELNLPMSGTYTIGSNNANYPTFNAAVNALNNRGVGGPVVFNVQSGVYNEDIVLSNVQGSSPSNTITFKSAANNRDSVTLVQNSGASNNYVVRFFGGSYFNLKSLTLQEQNTTYGRVIELAGSSQFDTIMDCNIIAPTVSTTSTNNAVIFASSFAGNNIAIIGNNITGGSYSAYMFGVSTAQLCDGMVYDNNNITGFYYMGLYNYYTSNLKIRNNNIVNSSQYSTLYATYSYYADGAYEVTGNKIYLPGGSTQYGIRSNYCDPIANASGLIANNSISIGGSGTNYGIYDQYNSNMRVMHNTVRVRTGSGYAAYFYHSSTAYNNNIALNNIFEHDGSGYAIYNYNTLYCFTDHNNLYTNGTLLGQVGTPAATFSNLAAWRAATGDDLNGISYPMVYMNDTLNMPIASDSSSWAINSRGTFSANIATDIDGTPRSTSMAAGAPDLGAYEVVPTGIAPLCTAIPAVPVAGSTQLFMFGLDTVCTIEYDQFATAPASVSVRQYAGAVPPQIGSATGYMRFYVDAQAPAGFYNYTMNLYYKNNWMGTLANKADLRLAKKNSQSPWQVYLFTSSSVDTTRGIISAPFLNDFSYFTGADNTNPLPVRLNRFTGSKQDNHANLNWTTVSEQNSKVFEIERSLDGRTFATVASVNAAGNSERTLTYQYTDRNVFISSNQIAYYRLKMIDKDGSFNYSNTIVIRSNADNSGLQEVSLFPNPVKDVLELKDDLGVVSQINIKDINGRDVYTNTFDASQTSKSIVLPSNLESGVYFVTLNNERTIKVIKQ